MFRFTWLIVGGLLTLSPLATSTANAQAQRFDLHCSGATEDVSSGKTKPDSRRYTLDLATKRWCRTTECSEAIPILKVSPDELTLAEPNPHRSYTHSHSISRVAGTYYERVDLSIAKGTCKPGPFSGFPKPKF